MSQSKIKSKIKIGLIEIVTGILLFAIACGFCYENTMASRRAGAASQSILADIQMQINNHHQKPNNVSHSLPQAVQVGKALGILEIPALALILPVQADDNEALLQYAPCGYSLQWGDIEKRIIYGHNYLSQFAYLGQLNLGDEIRFTDLEGRIFIYQVSGTAIIGQDDLAGLEAGNWDLTLFTCTISRQHRIVIRCQLD